jgi:hypothetical protein
MLASHKTRRSDKQWKADSVAIESIALQWSYPVSLGADNVKLTVKADAGCGQCGTYRIFATFCGVYQDDNFTITETVENLADFPLCIEVKYFVHGSEVPLWVTEFKRPDTNVEAYRWIGTLEYEPTSE